jgi:hypothetical protein
MTKSYGAAAPMSQAIGTAKCHRLRHSLGNAECIRAPFGPENYCDTCHANFLQHERRQGKAL